MLLIEPPLDADEWVRAREGNDEFQKVFEQYCRDYESAVLTLPRHQLAKILARLAEGMENCVVGAETFRLILLRELREEDFEASSKTAKLIVACALGSTLKNHGYEFDGRTSWLLTLCRLLIPVYLGLAIDDHFGMLPIPT